MEYYKREYCEDCESFECGCEEEVECLAVKSLLLDTGEKTIREAVKKLYE